jgi:hypothetical protein
MTMSNVLNMYGKDKEVEFISVNEEKRYVRIYFADRTFVEVKGIDIEVKERLETN